jgi:hypothetical protein
MATETKIRAEARHHVSKNQCYPGSRGGQRGNTHLHVLEPLHSGRLHREVGDGKSLCGRYPWWHREPEHDEVNADHRCPKCVALAEKHGVEWPDSQPIERQEVDR